MQIGHVCQAASHVLGAQHRQDGIMTDALELLKTRRSLKPVELCGPGPSAAEIDTLLTVASRVPDHGKLVPWRFIVFTGGGLQKLASFQAELYKQTAGSAFKEDKHRKLLTTPGECSHVISIGMKRSLKAGLPEMEDIAAVACAVQNIYLSVAAYGLGGYWTTGGITYREEAKSFFNLEKEDRLMGFFYLGYIQVPSVTGTRGAIAEKISWVRE